MQEGPPNSKKRKLNEIKKENTSAINVVLSQAELEKKRLLFEAELEKMLVDILPLELFHHIHQIRVNDALDELADGFEKISLDLREAVILQACKTNFFSPNKKETKEIEQLLNKADDRKIDAHSYEIVSKLSIRKWLDKQPLNILLQWENKRALNMAHARVSDTLTHLKGQKQLPSFLNYKQRHAIIANIAETENCTAEDIKKASLAGMSICKT